MQWISHPLETSSRTVLTSLLQESLPDLKQGEGSAGVGAGEGPGLAQRCRTTPKKARARPEAARRGETWGLLGPLPLGSSPRVLVWSSPHVKSTPPGAITAAQHLPHRPCAETGVALLPRVGKQPGLCPGLQALGAAGVGGNTRRPPPGMCGAQLGGAA